MTTYGIAKAQITQGSNIGDRKDSIVFDLSAFDWNTMQSSGYKSPFLLEALLGESNNFGVIYPQRRPYITNNFISGSSSGIIWNICSKYSTLVDKVTANFPKVEPLAPDKTTAPNIPSDYNGPVWKNTEISYIPRPSDAELQAISSSSRASSGSPMAPPGESGGSSSEGDSATQSATTATPKTVSAISQETTKDGMMWSIESSSFLGKGQPLWISMKRDGPPPNAKYENFLIIEIGDENGFVIYISDNMLPQVLDYYGSSVKGGSALQGSSFSSEPGRVMSHQSNIDVCVLTIAGRLVVYINKTAHIYTRVGEDGVLIPCMLPGGSIRISGSNSKITINACRLGFAPSGYCSIVLPDTEGRAGAWKGITSTGDFEGSPASITLGENGSAYGVDCKKFTCDEISVSPKGDGYSLQGEIVLNPAPDATAKDNGYYLLSFSSKASEGTDIAPNAPFFFRVRGGAEINNAITNNSSVDVGGEIMSMTVSATSSDYFSYSRTGTVTVYGSQALHYNSGFISFSLGWDTPKQIFVGLIISNTISLSPGRESVTYQCEDLMYILKNTPIINSPYYDGMLLSYAVKDLARRAGINNVIIDLDNKDEYFLSSGYVFSQPLWRFEPMESIHDCILKLIKKEEVCIFFDTNGVFHMESIKGIATGYGPSSATYSLEPDGTNVVIENYEKEVNFDSTVNYISIRSVDRDTRNPIFYTLPSGSSVVPFAKIMMIDEAAYGSLSVVRAIAWGLAKRVFYPIRKVSFKTAGPDIVDPLDFFTLDQDQFRCTGSSISYDAAENSIVAEYTGEAYGG